MLKRSAQWGGPGSVTPDASLPSRSRDDKVGVAADQERAEQTRRNQQRRKDSQKSEARGRGNEVKW